MAELILKRGREKSLRRRHPWVFSGSVADLRGTPGVGETVSILSSGGEFLAWGAYSPRSAIRARVWSWDEKARVDEGYFRQRLDQALQARRELSERPGTDSCRLVHAESDGLPGLIVDRYGDTLVVQYLSAGPERWRPVLDDLLIELTGAKVLFERSDAEVRRLEGLEARSGPIRGRPPEEALKIEENGHTFLVDVRGGHKTGFYLDQRPNRQRIKELASGLRVLDAFAYTGAFTVYTLTGGAERVLSVDTSADALSLAGENLAANRLSADQVEFIQGDVFQVLRELRDRARSFDLIVLDPPKFAPTAATAPRAARGYKDINLLAFKLLVPGGLLATFSCSGGVDADLFQKIVAGAALDAGVRAQIVERFWQGSDHPVDLAFPEGAYLKGLLCRVSGF